MAEPPIEEYAPGEDNSAAVQFAPPQDLAAETATLGAMLFSKDAITDVLEILKPTDFYRPAHEIIYLTIVDLYGRGEPADALTVGHALEQRGELAKIGGYPYLADLASADGIAANASYYAQIVHDKAVLRRLLEASLKITQLATRGEGQVANVVDQSQQLIYEVSEGKRNEDVKPISELLPPTFDEIDAIASHDGGLHGVPTGFKDFDDLTNGLHGGQMIIIAARPGIGKTTLALDFARSAAIHHNVPTAFFSLEMGSSEIIMRLLSAEARVQLSRIRGGNLNEDDWTKMINCASRINNAPLLLDDSPNLTMMEIRAKARRLKQHYQLGLILIDYMQLMTSGRRVESRQLEVSEFSRQIKLLAKELDIPVVALSQLNRGSEQRSDKRPMLSDLRESGSLEQDADLVILLHRDEYYNHETRPGEADMIIAKHRNGRTDTLPIAFQGQYSRFADMAQG